MTALPGSGQEDMLPPVASSLSVSLCVYPSPFLSLVSDLSLFAHSALLSYVN